MGNFVACLCINKSFSALHWWKRASEEKMFRVKTVMLTVSPPSGPQYIFKTKEKCPIAILLTLGLAYDLDLLKHMKTSCKK